MKGAGMAEASADRRGGREQGNLQPGLKRRHMTMIAIGGIIGAGLFVGTGPILNQAGPATILTYLLTGTILILIMRMLGEMAVALLVLLGDSGRLRGHRSGRHPG